MEVSDYSRVCVCVAVLSRSQHNLDVVTALSLREVSSGLTQLSAFMAYDSHIVSSVMKSAEMSLKPKMEEQNSVLVSFEKFREIFGVWMDRHCEALARLVIHNVHQIGVNGLKEVSHAR